MHTGGWHLPTRTASLFGKLPTVLDYVRIDHSFPAAIALDTFLSRAIQDLAVNNLGWPQVRHRFVFAPGNVEHALIGVMAPSRDRAGRKFPLSIFAPLPVAALAHGFARLPFACDAFFTAADALIDEAAQLSRDAAAEKLRELPMPDAESWQEAFGRMRHSLEARATAALDAALFAGDASARAAAFDRATQAAAATREGPLERVTVLDLPAADATDVSAWLLAVEGQLTWSRDAPSLFWTSTGEPLRLLVALGPPSPNVPLWMADKKRKGERLISLWPTASSQGATYGASEPTEAPSTEDAAADAPTQPSLWDTLQDLQGEP